MEYILLTRTEEMRKMRAGPHLVNTPPSPPPSPSIRSHHLTELCGVILVHVLKHLGPVLVPIDNKVLLCSPPPIPTTPSRPPPPPPDPSITTTQPTDPNPTTTTPPTTHSTPTPHPYPYHHSIPTPHITSMVPFTTLLYPNPTPYWL